MGRSLRFRVYPRRLNALFGLAFATAPARKALALPTRVTPRLMMQKARRQAQQAAQSALSCRDPPTACRRLVSGSISLPALGCFSPFPHGTCALSVAREYLALGGGPPGFPQDSTCPEVLGSGVQGDDSPSPTGLSPSMAPVFHRLRLRSRFVTPRGVRGLLRLRPTTPLPQRPRA